MSDTLRLHLLDAALLAFHGTLIAFNLTGWIWRRTRKAHLGVISATLFSWFGLGVFYGWGYCPLTDWHWQVKRNLGETGLPASCVKYYVDKVTGIDWSPAVVDSAVVGLGIGALAISIWLNVRDARSLTQPG